MAVINLGVDFGSTAIRAAYGAPGAVPATLTLTELTWPWLLCEPSGDASLPVSFPSVKSRLGIGEAATKDGTVAGSEVLAEAFAALRARVEADTSDHIGHTVISVPARYYTRQRTPLLDLANQAGLGTVSLVTDSIAAAVQQAGDDGAGSFLLVGLGYAGFELGVVRAISHRFRALGYDGGDTLGGASLDAQLLRGWWVTARQEGEAPWVRETEWRQQQERAEKVKVELLAHERLVRPFDVPDASGRTSTADIRVAFRQHVRTLVSRLLDRARVLTEQAGIGMDGLSAVVLFGGGTRISAVAELARELGAPVVAVPDGQLSLGALRCAHQMTRRSPVVSEEPVAMDEGRNTEAALEAPLFTTPLIRSSPSVSPNDNGAASPLDQARTLVSGGRLAEAEKLLRGVAADTQRLLDDIAAHRPPPPGNGSAAGVPSVARMVAAAREHFDAGRHTEAISTIHLAWEKDHRPEVFDEMIDIHCRAAMSNPTTTGFAVDMRWLRCALQNDPTNARIRELLAERAYLHGRELHRTGNQAEAKRALNHALSFKPDHEAADALLRRITRRRLGHNRWPRWAYSRTPSRLTSCCASRGAFVCPAS